jgi:hypothetical protein
LSVVLSPRQVSGDENSTARPIPPPIPIIAKYYIVDLDVAKSGI